MMERYTYRCPDGEIAVKHSWNDDYVTGMPSRGKDIQNALKRLADLEDQLESGELVRVVHGKWVKWDDDWFHGIKCTVCGEQYCCKDSELQKSKHCPNCGAKMDGKPNE
jgi:rubrerythrin